MPSDGVETLIRETAYELWEADGRPWGQDHNYWERAFALVMARLDVEPREQAAPAMAPVEGSASAAVRRRLAAGADFNLKRPAVTKPKRNRTVSAKARIARLTKLRVGGGPKRTSKPRA